MQELTIEQEQAIVARLRAMYLGSQNATLYSNGYWHDATERFYCNYLHREDGKLQLRSIDSLTDDEYIQVAKTYRGNIRGGIGLDNRDELIRAGKEMIYRISHSDVSICNQEYILYLYQYLYQIGIALPIYSLELNRVIEVAEMAERGWIKLTPNQ